MSFGEILNNFSQAFLPPSRNLYDIVVLQNDGFCIAHFNKPCVYQQ